MLSFRQFAINKKINISSRSSIFDAIIEYDGENIKEVEDTIRKVAVTNIQVRRSGIPKRKPNTDFIKIIQGANEFHFIFLNAGDLVCIRKREIFVFNSDYVKEYFDIDYKKNTLIPKSDEKSEK